MTMVYYAGSFEAFLFQWSGYFSSSDRSQKKVALEFDNISFVVVFVFVLFNSDLSCSRIGFVYEMNVLQEFLFY
jgi:hypothetical protein